MFAIWSSINKIILLRINRYKLQQQKISIRPYYAEPLTINHNDQQAIIQFLMSNILQNMKTEITKCRNMTYGGKYTEAIAHFTSIIDIITGQIPTIKDRTLISEWNRLLQQVKSEKNQATMIKEVLTGNFDPPVNKREKVSLREQGSQREFKFKQNNSNELNQNYINQNPSFKKKAIHQDDEIYNRKEKEQREKDKQEREREQRQKQFDQREAEIWPKKKPVQKKVSSKNATYSNPTPVSDNKSGVKGRQYSKPWLNGAKNPNSKNSEQQRKSFLKSCYPDGNGPDASLIQMLEKQVVNLSPNISFDDIAELQKAKELLEEAVLLPLLMPHLFTGIRRAWKGVLLFGPPGTGKTLLAKAIASGGKTTFFNVTSSTLASKWKGDSQKLVRILFEMAKFYAPTTIFFDQIDAIASKRGEKQDESSRKVKTELMARVDGVSSGQQGKAIVVIGATNRPWDLDEAILRRLQKRVYIPLPTEIGRREMFRISLREEKVDGIDFDELVRRSQGFSGADINLLCRDAAFVQMRKKLKKQGRIGTKVGNTEWVKQFQKDVSGPLTMQDFNESLKNVKSSIGKQHLVRFEKWMAEFGEQGTD